MIVWPGLLPDRKGCSQALAVWYCWAWRSADPTTDAQPFVMLRRCGDVLRGDLPADLCAGLSQLCILMLHDLFRCLACVLMVSKGSRLESRRVCL
jgi:hypothetical protein